MANYYSDIPELKYHLENPMMKRIVELKERDFRDKDEFDYAPVDYADAMDSYNKVLDIVGDITANVIAPNAEGVDEEGPHCHERPCGLCQWDGGEPGRHGQGRYERHDDAAQVQRVELPYYAVHDVCRGSGCRRCRFRKHLVVAGLYRNLV